jgi:Raf kinase inhibitor-like YbhB/YbcL family protein
MEKIFTLSSNTIKEGEFLSDEQILNGYGCTGGNVAPDLQWSGAPDGTKSYTLIMHDPDAPMEGGWYHWVVTNIPAAKTALAKGENVAAPATLGKTSFDKPGYGGACPPVGHGKHRYIFTVYALDVAEIDANANTAPNELEKLIAPHTLAKASITAYFERK